jgi:hypothetical protein
MIPTLLSAVLLAGTAVGTHTPLTPGTIAAWTRMNAASVTTRANGSADSMTCDMIFTPQQDTRIDVTIAQDGKTSKGTLMLVSGILVAKDLPPAAGSAMDLLDGCGITLQLANALLAHGSVVPPLSIRGRKEFDVTEEKTPLHVATTTAETTIPVPWSVKGWAESGTVGAVGFDIVQSMPGTPDSMRITGTWEVRADPPEFPDATSIAGWKVFKIGTREGGGYGATPAGPFANLGQLRSAAPKKP